MDETKPKTRVEVTKEEVEAEKEDWSFLTPLAVPVVIVLLVIGAFMTFNKKDGGANFLEYDSSKAGTATKSAEVAGANTQVKAGPNAPAGVLKTSPTPSVSVVPSPVLNNNPSPSPSPSPTPTPTSSPSPSPSSSPSASPTITPQPSSSP